MNTMSVQGGTHFLIQMPKMRLVFAKNMFFIIDAGLYNLLPTDIRESADADEASIMGNIIAFYLFVNIFLFT